MCSALVQCVVTCRESYLCRCCLLDAGKHRKMPCASSLLRHAVLCVHMCVFNQVPVLAVMEMRGMLVDLIKLLEPKARLEQLQMALTEKAYEVGGVPPYEAPLLPPNDEQYGIFIYCSCCAWVNVRGCMHAHVHACVRVVGSRLTCTD
jgi:hypothetical protein